MFDIKAIRDNPQYFDDGWARRGLAPQAQRLIDLDKERRVIIANLQDLQSARNEASKKIGRAKGAGDDAAAQKLIDEVATLKAELQNGEIQERELDQALVDALSALPNIPSADVPAGKSEDDNVELRRHGDKPVFDFDTKEHFDLGLALGLMDFEAAARLSGARFVVLSGALARLERALAAFMLDMHTAEFGYTEVNPPLLVQETTMYGTGQLPKFADDQFRTEDGMWLIPTAEVPLTNLVRESILDAGILPKRVTAYTPCFRLEAGAAGKDTRGMIRQHQFSKVELVSITSHEDSEAEHERLTACAEEILKRLGLHYRVMMLCTGDLGFSAHKTYDLEVWLPGQNRFREISSCSLCGDFQARRMGARYRLQDEKKTRYVHTMNGSGLAVGRTLVALLENYQNADGSIDVPQILQAYMGGLEKIEADQSIT